MNEITIEDFDGVFGHKTDHSTITQIIDAFKTKYPDVDITQAYVPFAIIAEFYSIQSLTLCGKLAWMKRDYERFIKKVTCRPFQIYQNAIAPKVIIQKVVQPEPDKPEIIDTFGT